ncbi:MAG: 1-(5-phosphoribosyl)-5-[(5-phosphoribosylamino)methylideneamino]imidazole-4-carboxamide isomerase [Phycisphaerae bacterium]|nr:1-(5-phosphoribosyl)-5-[(5-phosphoribosylamino)methylideneamino]imidazole-4-carboxamide isomerase [Phycisphaerae bacterium]
MDLLPAIDIRAGKCVRLIQGDYDRQIDYDMAPVDMARRFERDGAHWVHIVDLDGARQGRPVNLMSIKHVVQNTGVKVEVGGGIRDDDTVQALLDAGVARVVIGTQALRQWDWFKALVHAPEHQGRIALGLDAREGRLAVEGWTEETEHLAVEVAARVGDWPLGAIIYTDIGRDGMLLGPNLEATAEMARAATVPVIASGGVTDLDDIRRLVELPIDGIIVGRAIYEGQFEVAEAIRILESH